MVDWNKCNNKESLFNELYPIRVFWFLVLLAWVQNTRKQMQTSNTTWANIGHLCFFGYTLPACLTNIERDHNDRP